MKLEPAGKKEHQDLVGIHENIPNVCGKIKKYCNNRGFFEELLK